MLNEPRKASPPLWHRMYLPSSDCYTESHIPLLHSLPMLSKSPKLGHGPLQTQSEVHRKASLPYVNADTEDRPSTRPRQGIQSPRFRQSQSLILARLVRAFQATPSLPCSNKPRLITIGANPPDLPSNQIRHQPQSLDHLGEGVSTGIPECQELHGQPLPNQVLHQLMSLFKLRRIHEGTTQPPVLHQGPHWCGIQDDE